MVTDEPLKQDIIERFGTPCAVIDLDVVDRNIAHLQSLCDAAGPPPGRTSKRINHPFAKRQLAVGASASPARAWRGRGDGGGRGRGHPDRHQYHRRGAIGQAGRTSAPDVPENLRDNPVSLAAYAEAGGAADRPVNVLIECDTGRKRAGVETPGEAVALAKMVRDDPWLEFGGLLFYPLRRLARDTAISRYRARRPCGPRPRSGNHFDRRHAQPRESGAPRGATEHRAGTCIFNDRMMMAAGVAGIDDCALKIFTSVVSRGGKARHSGCGLEHSPRIPAVWRVRADPRTPRGTYPQHGRGARVLDSRLRPATRVGDILRVVPNHVCVAVNMFDHLVAVRGNGIVDVLPVAARGRLV